MIFEIKESCFSGQPSTLDLISMLHVSSRGRHRLYIHNIEDPAYLNWLAALSRDLAEKWQENLDKSIKLEALEPARLKVTVCDSSPECHETGRISLSVKGAEKLIREPLYVFVENDEADRNFLLTFSDERQSQKLRELEIERLLEFRHCGGIGELRNKINSHNGKSTLGRFNAIAVFDSDSPQPGEVSKNAELARTRCHELGISALMLKRRAIENYLMRDWVNSKLNSRVGGIHASKRRIFNAFCRMSQEQRNHYHMKSGLSVDQPAIDSGTIQLYNGISERDRRFLRQGFGGSIGSEIYAEEWVQRVQAVDDAEAWKEVNDMVSEILAVSR